MPATCQPETPVQPPLNLRSPKTTQTVEEAMEVANSTIAPQTDHIDGRSFLMDFVHYRTYAKTLPDGRKETRTEVIDRVKRMHQEKFFHVLDAEIEDAFRYVHAGQVVPSMRTMQFGGVPVLRSNARAYNCAFAALTSWADLADLFWLLMNGVGAGYSVQSHHILQLPVVCQSPGEVFSIDDSKEGWSDSIKRLMANSSVTFDYSLIRAKGEPLSTGGTASGPDSLMRAHEQVRKVLVGALGRQLRPIEAHDIMCLLADVVVVGGVRRAALISLFDADDEEMLRAKHGDWHIAKPWRARANNSAVILRSSPLFQERLSRTLQMCFDSNCGEPGISLTNDREYGFNPCHEISLRDGQLCNLTEINAAACKNVGEFVDAAEAAAVIGTMQAAYTDFSYLQPKWKENCDKDALLGISITGQAQAWEMLSQKYVLHYAAQAAVEMNRKWAKKLGIAPAARITCTKPSGSTSAWWGTTSGIHAAHAPYFLRRVRIDRKDEFGRYLINKYGEAEADSGSFIESDTFAPENIIATIPVNMEGAIQRGEESAVELMERAKFVYRNWILPGHSDGPNTHNVSLTVSYEEAERGAVHEWMLANVDSWAGISLLPQDGGSYQQAPFEAISADEYRDWQSRMPSDVDLSAIQFQSFRDEERQLGEMACAGGACEIR